MKNNDFFWVLFVSRRFANIDRNGRSAVTTHLASLGICIGVMALVVVISVMNGFQMSFIDAIMEVSSYHVRVSESSAEKQAQFENFCQENPMVQACVPFYEAQSLMVGNKSKESAALVRALPENVLQLDSGFRSQIEVVRGEFDLSSKNGNDSIVLGSTLADMLRVKVGYKVNLLALSGGNDVALLSDRRVFTVRGIIHTGYAEINSSYAFISLEAGQKYFGSSLKKQYGIKLRENSMDGRFLAKLKASFPEISGESWKSFNRSFFGALRVEKNMLMLFVFLIFVVVCINIFNGMRRIVFERRNEISILSALGGKNRMIQAIFIFRGFLTGIYGAVPGLILGLFLSVNIGWIFRSFSSLSFGISYFFAMLFNPSSAAYLHENPMFRIYAKLPARIVLHEILIITMFGICSSLVASWLASRGILKLKAQEVLRDE